MRNRIMLVSAVTALLLLTGIVSIASANRLSFNSRSFAMAWSALTFTTSSGTSVACPVALGGSFHSSSFTKTSRALIGYINGGAMGRCAGDGSATLLSGTLPWHVSYNGFVGTLPRMTGIRLLVTNMSFQVSDAGLTCLARTDAAEPAGLTATIEAGGKITRLEADPSFRIDIDTAEFLCEFAGDVSLSGSGSLIIGDIRDFLPSDAFAGDGGEALADSDALRPPNFTARLI